MPLSDEQMENARRYFRFNGVVSDCPYCGTGGWEAGEIISCPVWDEPGSTPASTNAAMVQFVCDNCGHVTLFNAARLGLIDA